VPGAREQYLQALASLSDLTRTQAERVASLLAKQGEVQTAQVNRVAEDLMQRTQKNREILTRLVQREVKRQLGVLGMASRDEVARLQQRVRALEQELERSANAASARPAAATESSPAAAKPAARTRATSSGTAAKPAARTRATSSGTAAKPATSRAKAGSSGTAKASTRSRSPSSGTAAKPSTRTRTGGTSSRSTASSPGTRRPRNTKGSAGSGSTPSGE
jgi:polyhydroxyalkanoate synthesis regulator phasin